MKIIKIERGLALKDGNGDPYTGAIITVRLPHPHTGEIVEDQMRLSEDALAAVGPEYEAAYIRRQVQFHFGAPE